MYEPDELDWYMYQVAMQRGLTVVVVIVSKVGREAAQSETNHIDVRGGCCAHC